MSNPVMNKTDTEDELNEYSDGEYVWSDEEGQLLDVVLALPALSVSEPPRNEAVVAAVKGKGEEVGGSSTEVPKKKVYKAKRVRSHLVIATGASSLVPAEGVTCEEEPKAPRKKGPSQLTNPPQGPPICNVCGKGFASWKAVFGHLKSHKDRGYVGFLPPPSFNPSEGGVSGVVGTGGGGSGSGTGGLGTSSPRSSPVGSGLGTRGLGVPPPTSTQVEGAAAPSSGYGTGGLEVDLNVGLAGVEVEQAGASGSGSVPKFDLNKSPRV